MNTAEKVLIAEMTSPEIEKALKNRDTVIIPLGSVEVLGTHGPLGADWFVASEISLVVGRKSHCLVAPAIPYGDTLELNQWPGTVCIDTEILKELYLAVARSFLRAGARRLIFLNCHSTNLRAADAACRLLRQEGAVCCIIDWWRTAFQVSDDLVESLISPRGHGGEVITSVIMALRSETVNIAAAVNEQPKLGLSYHGEHTLTSGSLISTYSDFSEYCESGAWGDVTRASAKKGKMIIERAITLITELIEEFRRNT